MLLRTPADIGAIDFKDAKNTTPQDLAQDWNDYLVQNLQGYEDQGKHVPGAFDKSPNYFDTRKDHGDATAPIPWNGFPRALDRWHKVLGDPTPAKQALAEATADTVVEYLFFWYPDGKGQPQLKRIPAHLVSLLPAAQQKLARRARLGSGTGAEITMCYRQQDEYCEWHADRDARGKLVRLSFTAEPPEYWTYLADKEPDLVFGLYKNLVGNGVQRDDIFYPSDAVVYGEDANGAARWLKFADKGDYNQYNKWNSTHGAVHLTHWANTLGAEIDLAARASIVWQSDIDGPRPDLDDDPALTRIGCAGYGGINRSSDPTIGELVGLQVVAGNRVSLTDPIGLYIASIDLSTLQRQTPKGRVPVAEADVLTISRGDEADAAHPRKLHLKLETPAGADWTLGDCYIDNRLLERAGQVARKITMSLYADVKNGGANKAPHGCKPGLVCRNPTSPGFFGTFDTEEVASCEKAKPDDWLQEVPLVAPAAHLAGHISTFDVKLDSDAAFVPKATEDKASTAPVGNEVVAAPPIASSRAKFR